MKKSWFVYSILVIISLLLVPAGPVLAQDQQPPNPPLPTGPRGGSAGPVAPGATGAIEAQGAVQAENGLWFQEGGESPAVEAAADINAQVTYDSFGYASKAIKYNWFDASAGSVLPMEEYTTLQVNLPFDFPFYERSYSSVWVNRNGYLSLEDYSYTIQSPLLYPGQPNAIIAPYWSPLYLYNSGSVYTHTGQDALGQFVAFEWYNLSSYSQNDSFTFEVLLYENGNIVFQYDQMVYDRGWWCASAGIEDWTGTVGRATLPFCRRQGSYRSVQFTRPAPAARVKVFPADYGAFGYPGGVAETRFEVINSGTLADDTYDFSIKSTWPVTLYKDDGKFIEPLVDTDGDRKVDTGALCVGCSVTILSRVQVPPTALTGKTLTSTLIVASSLKTSRKTTVRLQTTVPSPFVQGLKKEFSNQVSLVSPVEISTHEDDSSEGPTTPAVATLANGNILATWSDYHCSELDCEELYFKIIDSLGNTIKDPTKVQDLTILPGQYDFNGAPAAAPDGSFALTWIHEILGTGAEDQTVYNYNVYFAVFTSTGDILSGPTNLTNNAAYFDFNDRQSAPRFQSPHITATADNRYVVAWLDYRYNVDDFSETNIYTAILSSTGDVQQPPTAQTHDQGDLNGNGYDDGHNGVPNLTSLAGNRFLLTWEGWDRPRYSTTYKIYYRVFGSDGLPVTNQTAISCGSIFCKSTDAAQLSTGRIIVAWQKPTAAAYNSKSKIYYMVLNGVNYKKVKGPVGLTSAAALTGSGNVSVTATGLDRAVLTWSDYDSSFGRHLYYALLNKSGAALTRPVIFQDSLDPSGIGLSVNASGYGNTYYPPPQ